MPLTKIELRSLRSSWTNILGVPSPESLGPDLLQRALSWHEQAGANPHPKSLSRELDHLAGQLARSGSLDMERQRSLKPGTRLVRDWRGKTYTVTVEANGLTMNGRGYSSLSEIATEITGVKWSGPRFFGIKREPRRGRERQA